MTCVTKNEVNCNFLAQLDRVLAAYAYDFEFGIKSIKNKYWNNKSNEFEKKYIH